LLSWIQAVWTLSLHTFEVCTSGESDDHRHCRLVMKCYDQTRTCGRPKICQLNCFIQNDSSHRKFKTHKHASTRMHY